MRAAPATDLEALSGRSSLSADEVHLWWGRARAGVSRDGSRAWLSDEERARSERFHRERDAHAFLFRRGFLRAVLARYLACSPGELAFTAGVSGKPAVAGAALCFNLSRTRGWVLLGVARERELGLDVEHVRELPRDPEDLSRLARLVLGAPEQLELAGVADRRAAFLRAWTRKEALLKALGTGLSREPATLTVDLAPRALSDRWTVREGSFQAHACDLAAPNGCHASLVVQGGLARLSTFGAKP